MDLWTKGRTYLDGCLNKVQHTVLLTLSNQAWYWMAKHWYSHTLEDLVWGSCWVHLFLSQLVSLLSPSLPPLPVSSPLYPNATKRTVFTICTLHMQYASCILFLAVCLQATLTARIFLPSSSMAQGHQPLTDFWEKSDVGVRFLPVWFSMLKEHFSGVLAGGIRWSISNSTVPVLESQLPKTSKLPWIFLMKP